MAAQKFFYATGRRKTSTARIFLKPGTGNIIINGKTPEKYLSKGTSRMVINQPFLATANQSKFDCFITVTGGGETCGSDDSLPFSRQRPIKTANPSAAVLHI